MFPRQLLSLLAAAYFAWGIPPKTSSPTYFEIPLDPADKLHLYWTVDYEEETVTLELRAQVPDVDWVAVGFSNRGLVTNADFCFLWTDKRGKNQLQDVWTDEAGYVNVDDHDDCELLNLKRRGHVTRLAWSRKFDTCDPQDYYIEDGTTHIVYATGRGPIRRLEGIRIIHENHGFQRAQLLKNLAPAPVFPDDTQTIKINNDKVHVPASETTYWCSLHLLPKEFENKKHIIQPDALPDPTPNLEDLVLFFVWTLPFNLSDMGDPDSSNTTAGIALQVIGSHKPPHHDKYGASIQEGNEAVVHHMEIFHCEVSPEEKLPSWNGPCHSDEKPTILEACKRVLAAWAMGALPFHYPEEAGLPIGGSDFSRYVMLEVHYNNPEIKSDWIDSSGITLWYTPSLREFDAGVMELGLEYTDKMAIPSHQKSFTLTGYCVSECTRAGLPPEGVVIFGSQLHTHLTGIVVYTKHFRGGQELPELNRDNHYSTHFQEIRFLKRRVRVWPGDALLTTCHYSTMDRTNITLGGFAISDEMCVNYVHYFPKTDLEVCKSSIDSQVLSSYFRYMHHSTTGHGCCRAVEIKYNDEPTSEDKGISENYNSIHWSQNNADFLHQLYYNAPLSMQCNKSSGDRFPGYWEGVPRTEIFYPLPPPKRKCLDRVRNNEDLITASESK